MLCLIVDHHPVTSCGLAQLLRARFPDWQVETAATVLGGIERIDARHPDVVLVSLLMPDQSGLSLLAHIQQYHGATTAAMALADHVDADIARLCERLGARAYLSKAHAFSALPQAIRAVCARQTYFEPTQAAQEKALRFTPRQRDIVELLLIGYSNKQIACALNLSCGTVKNYIFDLMRITAVSSRLEMAMKLRARGYQGLVPD